MPDRLFKLIASVALLVASQQLGSAALIHAKARLAPLLMEQAWQNSLATNGQRVKPWPWADTWPVARLRVPIHEVSQIVLAGDTGNSLAFGPGHNRASAALGSPGIAMIGGHRDTHFSFLEHLVLGERIVLDLPDGASRRYKVSETLIIDIEAGGTRYIGGGEELLLVTCYPFSGVDYDSPWRFLVVARPERESVAVFPRRVRELNLGLIQL